MCDVRALIPLAHSDTCDPSLKLVGRYHFLIEKLFDFSPLEHLWRVGRDTLINHIN